MEEALKKMDSCTDRSLDILRYLDNQFDTKERENFCAHLRTCQECTAQIEAEQALTRLLRHSAPLYTAPLALRARVTAALDPAPARCWALEGFYLRVLLTMRSVRRRVWPGVPFWVPGWSLAMAVLLVACLISIRGVIRQVSAASYVEAATAAHRGYLNGNLPLEIQSESPEVVTAWFSGKLPFTVRLPSSQQDPSSRATYTLTGARLVTYKGGAAALVSYNSARKQPISLLITSAKLAAVAGGDEVHSGTITFHYHSDQGFKVITWTNGSLAYALVSDVSGSPRGSCLVCHQSMADHDSFRAGP
jgi:mycothiol system anti-sigma-R factor